MSGKVGTLLSGPWLSVFCGSALIKTKTIFHPTTLPLISPWWSIRVSHASKPWVGVLSSLHICAPLYPHKCSRQQRFITDLSSPRLLCHEPRSNSRQGRQGCCLRRALHMGQTGWEVGPGLGGWPPAVFSASHSYVLCLKMCVTGTRLLLLYLGAHVSTHTVLSLLAYQDLLSWGRKVLPLIPHLANGSCEAG